MPKEPKDLNDQALAMAAAEIVARLIQGERYASILRSALNQIGREAEDRGRKAVGADASR